MALSDLNSGAALATLNSGGVAQQASRDSSGGMAILRMFALLMAVLVMLPGAMLIFSRVWRGPALAWGVVLLLAALTIIATTIVGAVKRRRELDRSI